MDGILIVNKPKGVTSRDVVNDVCRVFGTPKVGHTGTLDPLATGVLVIVLGNATKLTVELTSFDKEYVAEVTLGIKTDTLDITGNILEKKECSISKEEVEKVLYNFPKSYNQEVPIYSAIKVKGKKLYEYARNNELVELPRKEVKIFNLELISFTENTFTFKTTVSKGTYIRSLIRDICNELKVLGTMSNLTRTRQGNFKLENAQEIDIKNNLIPIEEVLKDYFSIELDSDLEKKVLNGSLIDNVYNEEKVIFRKNKKVLAIYKIYEKDNTKMKPDKMFV